MLRFKLYSVESDEVLNIISLARMKPESFRFDPGFYQYGGAYLYPLGAWYYGLSKLGVLSVGSLAEMAAHADRMDKIYSYGRLFGLIGFVMSGAIFYVIASRLVSVGSACLLLGIYLAAPISVMFSQILKPHWYALVWVNLAILMVLRAFQCRRFGWGASALTGAALGLAVGSAQTFAPFSALIWVALVLAARRGILGWPHLIAVPLVAFVVFAMTNPYVFLNWDVFVAERNLAAATWFGLKLHPKYIGHFVTGSLMPGLGIAMTLLLLGLSLWRLVVGAALERAAVFGLIVIVLFVGYLNAELSHWHINLRYAPYLVSVAILFVGASLGPRRGLWLGICLALTVLQSVPMWLAYRDENDPARSTRLRAADWIEANVPAGAGVSVGTGQPAPYEVPPFDLSRYRINARDWQYQISVERQADIVTVPSGTRLKARFRPRLTTSQFPFVYSHINPQISIYQRIAR